MFRCFRWVQGGFWDPIFEITTWTHFFIPLMFLHLNSWKRYTFHIFGAKSALKSQNWPKMTKIRYLQMAIFQKNITSKMDENGLKYRYRTNLHFDIGLGWLVHEKFFTTAKLRFLAGQASLLDEASTGTQNWSVRAMPTSIQSISVISQTFRPFSVIWGLFWPILAIFGPKFKTVAD